MSYETTNQKKAIMKTQLEIEAFINHYGINRCLVGTVTLRGRQSLQTINLHWSRFIKPISQHIQAYMAVVDHSTPNAHVHFLFSVEEDVAEGIDREVMGEIRKLEIIKNKERPLIREEEEMFQHLRSKRGTNPWLRRYGALVRLYRQRAGFGRVWNLAPIYSTAECVGRYYAKGYAQANQRRKATKEKRQRLVYGSHGLPEGIRKPLGSFSLHNQWTSRLRRGLTVAANALRLPLGDLEAFYPYVRPQTKGEVVRAIRKMLDSFPGDRMSQWDHDAIRRLFENEYGEIPGMPSMESLDFRLVAPVTTGGRAA